MSLECKNIRAPITLFDLLDSLFKEKKLVHPALRSIRLVVRLYTDNTATEEQAAAIDNVLTALASGSHPPPVVILPDDIPMEVEVHEGDGTVMMFRSMGPDDSGPYVDHDRFMAKVSSTIRAGLKQLASRDGIRVLGLNIMSPDATITSSWLQEIRDIVASESRGTVECELTFHFGYIPQHHQER